MSDMVLVVSLKGGVLDVDDGGSTDVYPHPGVVQSIAWLLDSKTLGGCVFEPPGGDNGGFHWISTPHAKVFSTVSLSADRKRLTLEDTHVSSATKGEFVYMLRVRKSKTVVYSTTQTVHPPRRKGKKGKPGKHGSRTSNNPVIINR